MPIKKEKPYEDILLVIVLIIILALFVLFLLYRANNHYNSWAKQHEYLKQSNITIQGWMTIKTIESRFNITDSQVKVILNVTNINPSIDLNRFCIDYKIDCNKIITKLNQLN